MPRYTRNQVVLLKLESTYGTAPSPTGGANALLVSNLSISPLNASNVDRDLLRSYFGGSEQLVGSASVEVSFDVEFQSSGSIATPTLPAWDAALQSCGYKAGNGTPASRVEYDLVSDYSLFKSATLYYYDSGVLHKVLGAFGTASIKLGVGERPVYSFKFTGLDGGVTSVAVAAPTLTAFKTPDVISDPRTSALTLGCGYSAGALTAGTEYVSGGLELDLGNAVTFNDLLGTASLAGQSVDLTGRDITGKAMFDLTPAQEVTFMTNLKANTTQALGLVHGTTAGYKMLVFAPSVQMINPRKEDKNGRRMIGFDLRLLPSAGNDELKIVAL